MAPAFLEALYGLITVAFLVYFLKKSTSSSKPIRLWFLFGFLFNFISLSWFYTTYPIVWFPSGPLQLLAISMFVGVLALGAGAAFSVVGYAVKNHIPSWRGAFLFSIVLAVGEVLRSLAISTILSGNGGKIGLHFNAGTIGGALSSTPLVEYAYLGGTYFLTFILGFLIYLSVFYRRISKVYIGFLAVLAGLILIHFLAPIHTPNKALTIGIVATNLENPTDEELRRGWFAKRYASLNTATMKLEDQKPDIIVYPEDAQYIDRSSTTKLDSFQTLFASTTFLDGTTAKYENGYSNFSLAYSPANPDQKLGRGKVFLFPFNEYVPVFLEKLVRPFFTPEEYEVYTKKHTYIPFGSMGTFPMAGIGVGTLICSELSSFQTIVSLARLKPDLVIAQSNLAVFHNNPWFVAQYRSYVKVAAAQTRTLTISNANRAQNLVVSPYGKTLYAFHTSGAEAYTLSYNPQNPTNLSLVHIK